MEQHHYMNNLMQSEGNLKVTHTRTDKQSQGMEGYVPGYMEKKKGKQPQQINKFQNSYGKVSLGASKDGLLTIAFGASHFHNQETKSNDMKQYEASSGKMRVESGSHYYFNGHGEKQSAIVYQENITRSPQYMMHRIKTMVSKNPQEVTKNITPFLADYHALHCKPPRQSNAETFKKEEEERRFYSELSRTLDDARYLKKHLKKISWEKYHPQHIKNKEDSDDTNPEEDKKSNHESTNKSLNNRI